jgi:hypothetical protein
LVCIAPQFGENGWLLFTLPTLETVGPLIDDTSDWVTDMCKSNRMTDEMHRSHIRRAMRRLEVLQKELVSA